MGVQQAIQSGCLCGLSISLARTRDTTPSFLGNTLLYADCHPREPLHV